MLTFLLPISTCLGLRYSYSGMTEALYYSSIILIFASYIHPKKNWLGIIILFLVSLTRPYFLLFLLLFFCKDKYNVKEYLLIGLLTSLTLILYFKISAIFKLLIYIKYFSLINI